MKPNTSSLSPNNEAKLQFSFRLLLCRDWLQSKILKSLIPELLLWVPELCDKLPSRAIHTKLNLRSCRFRIGRNCRFQLFPIYNISRRLGFLRMASICGLSNLIFLTFVTIELDINNLSDTMFLDVYDYEKGNILRHKIS